jgi:hypothetical protein
MSSYKWKKYRGTCHSSRQAGAQRLSVAEAKGQAAMSSAIIDVIESTYVFSSEGHMLCPSNSLDVMEAYRREAIRASAAERCFVLPPHDGSTYALFKTSA